MFRDTPQYRPLVELGVMLLLLMTLVGIIGYFHLI